ncbi:MAG: glycerophosphodiester phosphodiesterase [Oscillospiraceae bacterium]|nr:glycerophosphodiester phosphodiesterase [Oscillospiraceae bacterium]
MIVIAIIALLLFMLYIGCVGGRVGHPGLKDLRGWNYAHRGLHSEGVPENSMAAFRAALDHGYGIEFDVHLLRDGNLAIIHDASLKRTAGADIMIEDLTTEDLNAYHLEGTEETIPTFRQLLDLYAGKAPLIIELKPERGNHAALTETVCRMLEDYEGAYCLESFDPRCITWLKKNRPELIRGQLSKNYFGDTNGLKPSTCFLLTHSLTHFSTMPDFTAYKFADRKNLSTWICRKLYGVQGVAWTLQTKEEYDIALKEGWIPIFENFTP